MRSNSTNLTFREIGSEKYPPDFDMCVEPDDEEADDDLLDPTRRSAQSLCGCLEYPEPNQAMLTLRSRYKVPLNHRATTEESGCRIHSLRVLRGCSDLDRSRRHRYGVDYQARTSGGSGMGGAVKPAVLYRQKATHSRPSRG